MSKTETRAVWIVGVVALLIVLYLLMRGKNTTINQEAGPTYTNYNLSPGGYQGSATGLPNIPAMTTSDCGCNGGATTGGFYASLNDMLQNFMTGATAAFNSYENNVYANQPNFVTQYYNNPAGVALANANQATITGA